MGKKLPTFQWATAARKPPEQYLATPITMDSGQSPLRGSLDATVPTLLHVCQWGPEPPYQRRRCGAFNSDTVKVCGGNMGRTLCIQGAGWTAQWAGEKGRNVRRSSQEQVQKNGKGFLSSRVQLNQCLSIHVYNKSYNYHSSFFLFIPVMCHGGWST